MKLLETRELVTGWSRPAHRPVSFTVERGKIIALTGPNGAGKSTILAALSNGGAQVFSGHLQFEAEARMGFLSQHLPPIEGLPLSGAELLALTGVSSVGLPAWLESRLHHRLDTLSGGQRQFLVFWSILQAKADLLLVDEPGNHMDKDGQAVLSDILRTRAGENIGIILVTHDQKLIQDCCDEQVIVEPFGE